MTASNSDDAQIPLTEVRFREARTLADLEGARIDLDFAVRALERLEELLESDPKEPDPILTRAYWSAALIAYTRCFSSGRRDALSEEIFAGIKGVDCMAIDVHRLYRGVRDKHVAHSVNAFEEVKVGVLLAPPGQQRAVDGVACISKMLISMELEGVRSLLEMARIALRHVLGRIPEVRQQVITHGRTLPLDELYESAIDGLRVYGVAPENVFDSRA